MRLDIMDDVQVLQANTAEAIAAMGRLTAAIEQQTALIVTERNEPYVSLGDLVTALGPAFGDMKIKQDLRQGLFKHGRDYINTSNGVKPNYGFRISRIRKVYQIPPENRKTYT
ncbi:MAG: hypothetical protein AAGB19_01565 [Cyanobacteria bacterium P01_F01_bin.3]